LLHSWKVMWPSPRSNRGALLFRQGAILVHLPTKNPSLQWKFWKVFFVLMLSIKCSILLIFFLFYLQICMVYGFTKIMSIIFPASFNCPVGSVCIMHLSFNKKLKKKPKNPPPNDNIKCASSTPSWTDHFLSLQTSILCFILISFM
jgi:hypothetical protein